MWIFRPKNGIRLGQKYEIQILFKIFSIQFFNRSSVKSISVLIFKSVLININDYFLITMLSFIDDTYNLLNYIAEVS